MEGTELLESCEKVQESVAYEYLCHLQEAKLWMESILKESLPPIGELEESLQNGVYLARIGNLIAPEVVPLSRIYDIFQHRYKACGLQFKHTDNINYWIASMNAVGFPKIFHPETMDVYNKKNMPKVFYCIHALSTHLFKLGKAPSIQDLYGKLEFNRDEIDTTCHELSKYGSTIPSFEKINGILMNESDCDQSALNSFTKRADEAITDGSCDELLKCLIDPAAELIHVIPERIEEYMTILRAAKEEKYSTLKNRSLKKDYEPDFYDEVLSQPEIQGYIRSTNCDCLWRDIQNYIATKNKEKLREIVPNMTILEFKDFKLQNVDFYIEMLFKLDRDKMNLLIKNRSSREVMENIVRNGNRLCRERRRVSDALNDVKKAVENRNLSNLKKSLTASALKLALKVSEQNMELYLKELETRLQLSGDLSYQDVKSSLDAVNQEQLIAAEEREIEESPIKVSKPSNDEEGNKKNPVTDDDLERRITHLQACIRGYLARREMMKRAKFRRRNHAIRPRGRRKRGKREDEVDNGKFAEDYVKHVDKIIKIQALWRGYAVRKSLNNPEKNYPKFTFLRRMILMHRINGIEYSEQFKIQTLRSSVLETIKKNQELASKLDEVDTKIGLLVHNRMLIQSIENEGKQLQNDVSIKSQSKGIKTFNKEAKTLLDGYRQLFYILQTDPTYLTRLITRLSQKSTHVIQSCILSLFNYGSSSRDAYLLLRLFRTALVEEVNCKFQKPIDAIKENPLVLRLSLSFSRQYEGFNPLRNILSFLIESVLNEKTYIDTNPVDIYRRWLNKMETETGKSHELPATVTKEEALSHPEVSEQLNHNLKILKMWVKTFLKRITVCADKFPYALRFIGKILWSALREKFPESSEKDIMKIVGNLVFYQYINSAIVAPDTFYIISLPPNQHLKTEQRRNLASIAKILQFAAWKKGFGMESQHLMCLNSFIISCHEEMKIFCKKCFAVEDLEEHFGITKYTEASLIEKPKIYITLEEICECHKILHEESHHISNNPFDPIQEVLESLGDPPSVSDLVGCSPEESALSRAGKTQICLELDNRFQLPNEDPTEAEKLFIKTKELIISRMAELKGNSLRESLESGNHSDIACNLMQLELMGMVKTSDDYQSIVKSIINDLTRKQRYQQNLDKEMKILLVAQEQLNEKRKYYEDQLTYYQQYLNTCLANLTRPSGKCGDRKLRLVKYTANQLSEKGILVSLEGVPSSHLKNVQFEISATEVKGIYSIRGRFMGVEVEKMNLDVQDLLQQQFEGQPVMNLFGKAKVNVNLLLHLINKKFHSRN